MAGIWDSGQGEPMKGKFNSTAWKVLRLFNSPFLLPQKAQTCQAQYRAEFELNRILAHVFHEESAFTILQIPLLNRNEGNQKMSHL